MEPITLISGAVSVLDRSAVDTDQIMPARYLKRVERTGFGQYVFDDWRKAPDWDLPPNPILATGPDFGSGSSREHAPWGLQDYGFQAIVAPSFADIFFSNCTKIGLVPVVLDEPDVRALMEHARSGGTAEVDLEALEVRWADRTLPFALAAERRRRLLGGLDDVAVTLDSAAAIDAFEASAPPTPDTTAL